MPDQLISIPLTGGVDSKRDPNTGVPGWFTELENAEFRKPGALTKRRGYTTVAAYDHGVGLGTGVESIVSAGPELLALGKGKMLSYTTSNGWRLVGKTAQVRLDERHVFRGASDCIGTDVAVIGDRACAVWHDGTDSYYAVYDIVTGTTIKAPVKLGAIVASSALFTPRVVAGPSTFVAVFPTSLTGGTTTVYVREITTSGGYTTDGTIRSGVRVIDLICNGSTVVFAIGSSTGVEARTYTIGSWGAPTATATITDGTSGSNTCCSISVTSNGTNYPIAWCDTTTPTHANLTTFADSTLSSFFRSQDTLLSPVSKVVVQYNALTGVNEAYADTYDSVNQIKYVVCSARNFQFSAGSIPNVLLAGKPFATSAGVSYVPVLYDSGTQPVLLIMGVVYTYTGSSSVWMSQQTTVGRAYYGEVARTAGVAFTGPSHAPAISATQGVFALERATRLTTIDGTVTSIYGPSSVVMTAGARPSAALFGNTVLIASGSILYAYDGGSLVEHGFHVYPEILSVTQGAAGSVPAGSHSYTIVYSWTDRNGRVHRSAPADPVTITLSANSIVNVKFRTYTVPTEREPTQISYDVYRTAVNSTVYQKVASLTGFAAGSAAEITPTFADNVSDTAIAANEVLYTNAGRPANIAPPNARTVAVHGNRAWVLSGPRRLYYSHQLQDGEAPSFSDVLYIDIERDVVAVASMDERLIVLCEDRIYSIAGDGPTLQGTLSDYARPVQIASDVGCTNSDSVVLTSQGLMFQSQRGIVMLDRSYQMQPIGAPVDGFLDGSRETLTITGAAVVADRGQVRFVSAQGRALVFDMLSGRWTTFTNHAASGCAIWGGRFVHARADGTLCLGRTAAETSSADVFRDGTTPIVLRFKLPWLALAGAALQRLKRIHVLGTWQGPHALAVTAWADQDTTPSAYVEWTEPTDVVIDYEVRAHVSKQKARSHMIEVKDVQHSGYWGATGANEGCEISAVSLLVSGKTGVKTSDVKSVGV